MVFSRDSIRRRDHSFACSTSLSASGFVLMLGRSEMLGCDRVQRYNGDISLLNKPRLHPTEVQPRPLDFLEVFGHAKHGFSTAHWLFVSIDTCSQHFIALANLLCFKAVLLLLNQH
jgi:hypothetical protein